MNRRRFLTMLGLAPAAAAMCAPSIAAADKPRKVTPELEQYRVQQYINMYGSMDAASQQQFEMQARRQRQAALGGTCRCTTCAAVARAKADFQAERWDRLQAVRYEFGDLSDHEYRAYLTRRLAREPKYSNGWLRVTDTLAALDRETS